VKERPILFNDAMVRAILDGRKTQTRRIVKFNDAGRVQEIGGRRRQWHRDDPDAVLASPYGQPGDRLWVRERILRLGEPEGRSRWCRSIYGAGDAPTVADCWPWQRSFLPPMHMPRGLSRITLSVTSVRVERLQCISEDDARAEGVTPFRYDPEGDCWDAMSTEGKKHRVAFEYLWGFINGYGPTDARKPGSSWAENPLVWVVGFARAEVSR